MGRPRAVIRFLFSFVLLLTSLSVSVESMAQAELDEITVAAASDLRFALERIKADFGSPVKTVYGSTGSLASQILQGAPYDVFLSADSAVVEKLVKANRAVGGSEVQYARGAVVLWVLNESSVDLEKRGLSVLLDPKVRKISLANPIHAPYGRAAEQALKAASLYEKIQSKLVVSDNVAQAAQFVQSKAVDVGIIASSLAKSREMEDTGKYWVIPERLYSPLDQVGVVVKGTASPKVAKKFLNALREPSAKKIFLQFGYSIPR